MRTKEQARSMLDLIQKDLDSIPQRNIFGESNQESMVEMTGFIRELETFISTGQLSGDKYSEVRLWVEENQLSTLGDFGEI